MENKDFKKMFDKNAVANGFESLYGGWFKESDECILVLELQKSSFSNYYYLNYKIFIQGAFKQIYKKNKILVNNDMGDVLLRQPKEFNEAFKLSSGMTEIEREKIINNLFEEFINPLTIPSLSKTGIKVLVKQGVVELPINVREELDKLTT